MSQQRNPRYWASQWYATKFADEPWPEGWYWHDTSYTWSGPYRSEEDARTAMGSDPTARLRRGGPRQPVVIDSVC